VGRQQADIHRSLEKCADDRVQTARDIYNEVKHVQKQLESGSSREMRLTDILPRYAVTAAVVSAKM